MTALGTWLQGLAWVLVPLTGLWLVSVARRDASVIDVFWGPGFAVLLGFCYVQAPAPGLRGGLLLGAVVLWAVRLGLHLGVRWWQKGEEDHRYAAMRESNPGTFPVRSLFTVFWFQGLLIWLLGWPLVDTLFGEGPPGITAWVGVAVFLVGLLFEAVADAQLARFKADPANRGQVLDTGLWRYSRHPNYFGEAFLWWGLGLIAVDAGVWLGLATSAAVTALVFRISGVPLLEPHLENTRPGYAEYARRTSAFIPWFPRDPE